MKKLKNICSFFLVFLIIFSSFMINGQAAEKTLGDLRRAYEALVAEKRANDNKTDAAKAEIAKREAAIAKAEEDISAAEYEQEEAQLKIDESNEKITSLKLEAEKILQYLQQVEGQNAYVEYISGASSMTDLVTRIEAVKQVTDYIQTTMDNLQIEIKNNEDLKVELENKKSALDAQIINYQNTINTYYSNIEEYNKYAQDIDQQLAVAKQNYELNKQICKQNLGKTDDSLLLSDCSKVPVNSGWLKPTKSGVLTSLVGTRWGRFHNAVDVGISEGTPVYATAAGKVIATYYRQKCGGNEVFIYSNVNGTGYTHYYYHLLSYNVKVGDIVDQNTIIGYSGGGKRTSSKYGGYDTCTTGAHLHYGIATGYYTSHVSNQNAVLKTLPGYGNYIGYRWTTRTAYYK